MQLFERLQAPWYQSSLLPAVLLFIRICTAVATIGWDTKHILPVPSFYHANKCYLLIPSSPVGDKNHSRGHLLDVY